jgi:hypothetical protein
VQQRTMPVVWLRSQRTCIAHGIAKRSGIPAEVLAGCESDAFLEKLKTLRCDFRGCVGRIQNPNLGAFYALFTVFVQNLTLLAARDHPDRDQVPFREHWLRAWVKDEALREWRASAPPAFNAMYPPAATEVDSSRNE